MITILTNHNRSKKYTNCEGLWNAIIKSWCWFLVCRFIAETSRNLSACKISPAAQLQRMLVLPRKHLPNPFCGMYLSWIHGNNLLHPSAVQLALIKHDSHSLSHKLSISRLTEHCYCNRTVPSKIHPTSNSGSSNTPVKVAENTVDSVIWIFATGALWWWLASWECFHPLTGPRSFPRCFYGPLGEPWAWRTKSGMCRREHIERPCELSTIHIFFIN